MTTDTKTEAKPKTEPVEPDEPEDLDDEDDEQDDAPETPSKSFKEAHPPAERRRRPAREQDAHDDLGDQPPRLRLW